MDKNYLEAQIKAFKKYLPQRIVEKIVANPYNIKVEGERKFVTILFGDVSGFTALSERLDPEEVIKVINKYFNKMLYIVDKYGGDVDKFVGDAIMVVFGAPVAHSDDPERAVRAALEMQQAIETIEPIWAKDMYVKVRMSIGINTGEIVALNMGTEDRLEYTVMGDNVNLSARLEAVANAGEVIISDRTYKYVKDKFEFEKMEPVKVKGKEKPIQIYKVLKVKEQKDAIKDIPLVGLNKHIRIIENAFESFLKEKAFYLHIYGESGTGKSLLIQKTLDKADRKNIKVLYIKGETFNKKTPLGALKNTLSHIFKIDYQSSIDDKKNKIDNIVSKEFRRGFYYIYQVLDSSVIDKNTLINEIIYSLKHLFETYKLNSKLLLVFEDFKNYDELTKTVVLNIINNVKDETVSIVISNTEELSFNGFERLKTKLLTQKQSNTFIKNILKIKPSEKLSKIIFEKTKGNPAHILLLINFLNDNNYLIKGNKYIDISVKDISNIPNDIRAVFIEQLDNLPEQYKQFLQYTSILGESFNKGLIEKIYNYSVSEIDECLKYLIEKEFLIFQGNNTYEFKTTLFRNAIYNSLMKNRKKELHAKIAYYLKNNIEQSNRGIIIDIAYHFDASEDIDNAPIYLELSGDIKRKMYLNNDAIDDYMRAAHYYNLKKDIEKYNKSILKSLIVYVDMSDFDAAETLLNKNKKYFIKDKRQKATYYNYMGVISERKGEIKKAIEYYEKGLKQAKLMKNEELLSGIFNQLGVLLLNSGDLNKAENYFIKALNKSIRLNSAKDITTQYINLARINIYKREFEKAENYLKMAIDIQRENKLYEGLMISYLNLAVIYESIGQIQKVKQLYEEVIDMGEKTGNRLITMKALNNLAVLDFQEGNYEIAIERFEKLKKEAEVINDISMLAEVMGNLAEIKSSIGEYRESLTLFEQCFQYAEKVKHLHLIGYEKIHYANTLILLGYLEKANNAIKENIDLAKNLQNMDYILMSKDLQAKIFGIRNNIDKEIEILEDIYKQAKKNNNIELMMNINSTLIKGLINKKDYIRAEKIANEVLGLLKKIPNMNIKSDILTSLSDIYVCTKQYDKLANISQSTYQLSEQTKSNLSLLRMIIVLSRFYYSVEDYTSMENELKTAEKKARDMELPEYLIIIYELYEKLYSEKKARDLLFDIKSKKINVIDTYIKHAGVFAEDLIVKRAFGNYYIDYMEFLIKHYDKTILLDNIKNWDKLIIDYLKKTVKSNLKKYIK